MTLRKLLGLSVFLILSSGSALALEGDRDLPITGSADTTSINTSTGENVLSGNVTIRQGALSINAERIIIRRNEADGQIVYMMAMGSPAVFRDTPNAGSAEIIVEGLQIEYFPNEDRIVTTTDARIFQAGNEARGARIEYNIVSGVMQIDSERSAEGTADGKQAEFIIQPGVAN